TEPGQSGRQAHVGAAAGLEVSREALDLRRERTSRSQARGRPARRRTAHGAVERNGRRGSRRRLRPLLRPARSRKLLAEGGHHDSQVVDFGSRTREAGGRVARPPLRFIPRNMRALILGLLLLSAGTATSATGWIPPRSLTVLLPSASFAPNTTHPIQMTLRANGAPANLSWVATVGGSFVLGVSPSSGSITIPSDSIRTVTLNVTVPPAAIGPASLAIEITDQIGGGHVAKATSAIFSASAGLPEVWPNPGTFAAPARTSGNVTFTVHSTSGTSELIDVTDGRDNPDNNNDNALFPGTSFPPEVNLPAGGTITLNEPTTIAGSAYAGNANLVQCSISSVAGITSAVGFALSSAALPESLPAAMFPVGLTPFSPEPASSRDGPVEMASRGVWLVCAGVDGVRVLSAGTPVARIGPVDTNNDGADDRLVGRFHVPSYAAALTVVPGFVGPGGDTLDLGLLAAGRAGLMVLDLRAVMDP